MIRIFALACGFLASLLPSVGCLYLIFWLNALQPCPWWVTPTQLITGVVGIACLVGACAYFLVRSSDV